MARAGHRPAPSQRAGAHATALLPRNPNHRVSKKVRGEGGVEEGKRVRELQKQLQREKNKNEKLLRGPPVLTPAQRLRKEELVGEIGGVEREIASLEERRAELAPMWEGVLGAIKKARDTLSQEKGELGEDDELDDRQVDAGFARGLMSPPLGVLSGNVWREWVARAGVEAPARAAAPPALPHKDKERLLRPSRVLTEGQTTRKRELGVEIHAREEELAGLERNLALLMERVDGLRKRIKEAKNALGQSKGELGRLF
ncbi:hypothetical protein FQN54_005269 [Arachnomyces sp. PD_36]|nr:hypothetical protein FQN54_005269 [Arachnomyces sp. PD_36]